MYNFLYRNFAQTIFPIMKYLHLIIILFSLHLFAQKNDMHFSKSRLFINSTNDIKTLIDNGIAADHGTVKQNTYIESVFSTREIEKAKELGYKVDIIIEEFLKYRSPYFSLNFELANFIYKNPIRI